MEKTENSTPYSPRYGEAETGGTGRLKIFFGYAAGVGKTYAMLEAAHQAQKEGVDVVVGYVEPHARPDTLALLEGLEVLSCREVDYRGIRLREFDLDGALARRPQLILVDELAHSNAPGCRHTKRYQDVEELLQAGINVYTTVNVQHLESLNDLVTSITGIVVNERIPDHVFDRANQVELVDIAPADLEKRLEEGKIYRQRQAKQALENFFTAENLTALREIAMRRTADQLNRTAVQEKKGKAARAGDHILICLSSAPSNAKVIRTAARMAEAFHSGFTALFVQTPETKELSGENIKRQPAPGGTAGRTDRHRLWRGPGGTDRGVRPGQRYHENRHGARESPAAPLDRAETSGRPVDRADGPGCVYHSGPPAAL